MHQNSRIWHLMARSLNKEATEEELRELHDLLRSDESLQQRYELLTRVWSAGEQNSEPSEEETSEIISGIIRKASVDETFEQYVLQSERRRRRRRRMLLSGAAATLVIAAGFLFVPSLLKKGSGSTTTEKHEVLAAQNGSRSRSMLPDGTTVWLNAGSVIRYKPGLTGSRREVELTGEAFFDVVKDAEHPFIVHTAGVEIKVLGTAFNVKSYPEDKTVETTLYHGSVEVIRENDPSKKPVLLRPNQKLVIEKQAATDKEELSKKETGTVSVTPVPASYSISLIDSTKKDNERLETAWIYSRLEFRGDNFEELALKMERWFNVRIRFTDEKVKQMRFNGSFEAETIDQALAALQAGNYRFIYKINGHEISISSLQ